jgi:hypothetical protein
MRLGGRELTERDLIALIALIILVAALIGSGVWMQMRAKAVADAKARAAAEAVLAAQPKQAPPITTSVYVRSVPVRHAQ